MPQAPAPRTARPAFRAALVTLALAAGAPAAWAADTTAAAAKPYRSAIVETLNKLSGGLHAGYHAKGVLVTGEFMPAPPAKGLSKAAHFAERVPVLVRFSNSTGVSTLPDVDGNASPHGIAIRFQLPGGANTDIVSISANGFPISTPEEFLELLQTVAASGPTAAQPTPIEQFLGIHPVAAKFVTTARPAPVSFGTLAFYCVNAFKFTNAPGVSRYARYRILPVAGEQALSAADAGQAAPNYLMDELPQRIAKGAVKFRLIVQLSREGDPVDGSVAWPAGRELIELSLNKTPAEQVTSQKALLFNPLLLPAGIEPSADPVLLASPGAYAASHGQRAQ